MEEVEQSIEERVQLAANELGRGRRAKVRPQKLTDGVATTSQVCAAHGEKVPANPAVRSRLNV